MTAAPEPLISVVTPAFNCEAFLPQCIGSVGAQTFNDWELLIVDDGSSDRTLEIAQSAEVGDGRIVALRHPDGGNHGVSAARNLALGVARGTYIAFLDGDDSWLPHKLERQAEILCREGEFVLSYTRAACVNAGNETLPHPDWPHLEWVIGHASTAGRIVNPFGGFLTATVGIPIVTAVARRQPVLDAGGFAEGLRYQVEDAVLLAQLCRAGPVHFMDEILAHYRMHPANFTASLTPLTSVESVWELYRKLSENCENPEPELVTAMVGCIDRYLTEPRLSWGERWRGAQGIAGHLAKHGLSPAMRVYSHFLTALPVHLKRQLMIGLRRRTGVGPTPWRRLLRW